MVLTTSSLYRKFAGCRVRQNTTHYTENYPCTCNYYSVEIKLQQVSCTKPMLRATITPRKYVHAVHLLAQPCFSRQASYTMNSISLSCGHEYHSIRKYKWQWLHEKHQKCYVSTPKPQRATNILRSLFPLWQHLVPANSIVYALKLQ